MTAPVHEQTLAVPVRGGPVDSPVDFSVDFPVDSPVIDALPPEPVAPSRTVDHVRAHSHRCYWDLTQCRWVCRGD